MNSLDQSSSESLGKFIEGVKPSFILLLEQVEKSFNFPKKANLPTSFREILNVHKNAFLVRKSTVILAISKTESLLLLLPDSVVDDLSDLQTIKDKFNELAQSVQVMALQFSLFESPRLAAKSLFGWFCENFKPKIEEIIQLFKLLNLQLESDLSMEGDIGRKANTLLSRLKVDELLADLAFLASNPNYPQLTGLGIEELESRKAIFEAYNVALAKFESRFKKIEALENESLVGRQLDDLEALNQSFETRLNSVDDFPSQQDLDDFIAENNLLLGEIENILGIEVKVG